MGEVCKERKLQQQRRSSGLTTKKQQQKGVFLRQWRRGRCSFSGEPVPTANRGPNIHRNFPQTGSRTDHQNNPRQRGEFDYTEAQPISVQQTMVSEGSSLMPSRQFNFPSVTVQRQQATIWNAIGQTNALTFVHCGRCCGNSRIRSNRIVSLYSVCHASRLQRLERRVSV